MLPVSWGSGWDEGVLSSPEDIFPEINSYFDTILALLNYLVVLPSST